MILSVLGVTLACLWAKMDYYWATESVARGGNSKGVRSLHRQNHMNNDYSAKIVNLYNSESLSKYTTRSEAPFN